MLHITKDVLHTEGGGGGGGMRDPYELLVWTLIGQAYN